MRSAAFWRTCCVAMLTAIVVTMLRPATVDAQGGRTAIVATVNLETVINGMAEREYRQQRLQEFIEERDSILQEIVGRFEAARAQVDLAPAGSPERRAAVEEATRLQLQAQLEKEFSEQLIAQRRAEVFAQLFSRIQETAARIARQRGVDAVISSDASAPLPDGNEQQVRAAMISRRVLFNADAIDYSDELLQVLNNEWAAGGNR
ncbi:MAG: OmpH family outer membrane protein [Phycisphaerales bacterium]